MSKHFNTIKLKHTMSSFASQYPRFFFWSFYCPTYYFQKLVDQHQMHFDPNQKSRKQSLKYRINKNPLHISAPKFFVLAYFFRCFAVVLVSPATDSREKRILLGTEAAGPEYRYLEATFLFWSLITLLFLQFTLSSDLRRYKWMALFRMSNEQKNTSFKDRKSDHFEPSPKVFELDTSISYRSFSAIRNIAFWYYNIIVCSLNPLSIVAMLILLGQNGLLFTHTCLSLLWIAIHFSFFYIVIASKLQHFFKLHLP